MYSFNVHIVNILSKHLMYLEALTKLDSRFRGNDMSGRDARVPRIA